MPLLDPKSWISDDCQVERFLGQGAFAEVYKVNHRFLGTQALKVFKTPCGDLAEIQAALSEAILLSRLGHPNIVRVFNAGVVRIQGESHGFFTMEYVQGGTLEKFRSFQGEEPLPIDVCLDIVHQTALGLSIAHSENPPIIHRDIKPQNILVSSLNGKPHPRLADFGLAKQANPMTLMLSARGTLAFKAPEAFSNSDSTSGDVWALGCVLYYLLADRHPFPHSASVGEIVKKSDSVNYRPPSRFNIQVEPMLDALVEECLAFDATKRIQNANILVARIHELCAVAKSSPLPPDASNPGTPDPIREVQNHGLEEINKIIEFAKNPNNLRLASELLEPVLIANPDCREQFAHLVELWRRGISM